MLRLEDMVPVHVFPDAMSCTVHTPILIGVVLMALGSEVFGVGFVGLMVPGYLAPVLLLKPWSGTVIILEAIVTYLLTRGISDGGRRLGLWAEFFSRSRLLALVVVSVLVRAALEGYLVTALPRTLAGYLPADFDYQANLTSIGLVAVPLMASMFWKKGFLGGIPSVLTLVAATYLCVRFVLLPYTNFSISHLELTYDSVAIDLSSNPKSYILLICGLLMGTNLSQRYGWTFTGVLVPALLTLAWFEPTKLVATCIESSFIYVLVKLTLKLPLLGHLTVEGSRKVVLCYCVGWCLKMTFCSVIDRLDLPVDPVDFFGLGYLLPTLLAVHMLNLDNPLLVLVSTLYVSGLGAALGSAVGFGLMLLVPASMGPPPVLPPQGGEVEEAPNDNLWRRIAFDRRSILLPSASARYHRPSSDEEAAFSLSLRSLRLAMEGPRGWAAVDPEVYRSLEGLRLTTAVLPDRRAPGRSLLYVAERHVHGNAPKGHGFYVLRARARNQLVIEVPRPLAEAGALQAAAVLFDELDATALFVAGAHPDAGSEGSADVMLHPRSLFQAAHQLFSASDILIVRSQRRGSASLAVRGEVPASLDIPSLGRLLGPIEVVWRQPREFNLQVQTARGGVAQLMLSGRAVAGAMAALYGAAPLREEPEALQRVLRPPDSQESPGGGELSSGTIEFLEPWLLAPLSAASGDDTTGAADSLPLRELDWAAGLIGYQVVWWPEPAGNGSRCLMLVEAQPATRHWGTFIFRLGEARPLVLQVPEPVRHDQSAALAVLLFQSTRARALCLGAASPVAESAGSLFSLVHRALSRRGLEGRPELTVQFLGFAAAGYPGVQAEMVLSPAELGGEGSGHQTGSLMQLLQAFGCRVWLQDHSEAMSPLAGAMTPEAAYTQGFKTGPFYFVHVADTFRRSVGACVETTEEAGARLGFLPVMGIQLKRGSLARRLAVPGLAGPPDAGAASFAAERMHKYVTSENPLLLEHILRYARAKGGTLEHFLDLPSATESFLLDLPGQRLLFDPHSRHPDRRLSVRTASLPEGLQHFLLRRLFLLEMQGDPR